MRAVVQRVSRAAVCVGGREVARIEVGFVVLLGVLQGDGEAEADRLADRVARFRIFADTEGRTNLAGAEVGAEALVVSQFTLAADGKKGRRPSFDRAAAPDLARPLVERFAKRLGGHGLAVQEGVFGAEMEVEIHNHGPATYVLDEDPRSTQVPT